MKSGTILAWAMAGFVVGGVVAEPASAAAPVMEWGRQIGTTSADDSYSAAVDAAGNVYMGGSTKGSLVGSNKGIYDAFVAQYDGSGSRQWIRQMGTSGLDYARSVASAGAGGVYVTGWTDGSLSGPNVGYSDAFLSKFDSSGNPLWTRQIGSAATDIGSSVAADGAGGVYIAGWTSGSLGGTGAGLFDAFLMRYDASGSRLWSRQLGSSGSEECRAVVADGAGGVYITGYTDGPLGGGAGAGGMDAFLAKYDAAGNLIWSRKHGSSSHDDSFSVAVDGTGGVYIAGITLGGLDGSNAGLNDLFLIKYEAAGDLLWVRQIGTSLHDRGRSVVADGAGRVFVTGYTAGSLVGSNAGYDDAFLIEFDADGNLVWSKQIGSSSTDRGYGLAADGADLYVTGSTWGSLGGPYAGGGWSDSFLIKYVVPEPATLALLALGGLGVLGRVVRRRRR